MDSTPEPPQQQPENPNVSDDSSSREKVDLSSAATMGDDDQLGKRWRRHDFVVVVECGGQLCLGFEGETRNE